VTDSTPRWILGDLDLTTGGLSVVAASFDPGQSAGSGDTGTSRTVALTVLASWADAWPEDWQVSWPGPMDMTNAQAALDRECAKTPYNVLRYLPGALGPATRYVVGSPTVTTVPDEDAERAGFRKIEISWPTDYFPTTDEAATLSFSGGAQAVSVGGSRQASLSLAVVAAGGLGTVLACTQPDRGVPWNPSLRQWTPSPGGGSAIAAPPTFHSSQKWRASLVPTIPAASMQAGPHALTGRFYRASAGTETISWTGPNGQAYSASVTWAAGGAIIVPLGVLVLDPASGDAGLNFSFSANVYVDDVFATYAGQYSGMVIVDCGTDPSLWVNAPSADSRMRGSVKVGSATPGRSPGVGLIAASDLPLMPSTSRLYVAATDTQAPNVTASWLPAVQTHAVEVAS